MEADTKRSRPPSSLPKRKPLSDSTNLIVSTSTTLCNLPSSLSTKPPFPNPIPKGPKPKPNSKPYNSSANEPDTNSSTCNTRIGLSHYNNNNNNDPNPSSSPRPHLSTPPIAVPGNESEEVDEPLVVYSRRQSAEKIKSKGSAVAVPFTCSPLQTTKDNAKLDTMPVSCLPLQKTKDKGKAADMPFTCSCMEKTSNKGKSVAVPPSFALLGETKDKGKTVSVPVSCPSLVNTRNKGKAIAVPFSCPPLSRTRKRRNEFNEAGNVGLSKSCSVPHPKHKKLFNIGEIFLLQKRRCVLLEQDVSKHALPQEFIEEQRAYFNEIDEFELPEEEVSENELDNDERNYYIQDMK